MESVCLESVQQLCYFAVSYTFYMPCSDERSNVSDDVDVTVPPGGMKTIKELI